MRRSVVPAEHGFSKLLLLIIIVLVVDTVLFSLVGMRAIERNAQNAKYEENAQKLLQAADNWRRENNGVWPEVCVLDPGSGKLCNTGEDRDAIVTAAELDGGYEVFVVLTPQLQGDITKNSLVTYGLSKRALILVGKAACFQERELSESSSFSVIYGIQTRNGVKAACV